MLVALPLQGFAAAMVHCASSQHELAEIDNHTLNHSLKNHHPTHDNASIHHHDNESSDKSTSADSHADNTDSRHLHKAACCVSAIALPANIASLLFSATTFVVSFYKVGALPTVFLEGPKHPPRHFLA